MNKTPNQKARELISFFGKEKAIKYAEDKKEFFNFKSDCNRVENRYLYWNNVILKINKK